MPTLKNPQSDQTAHTAPLPDLYQQEYIEGLVEKWDELIDWDRRAKSTGDFFIHELKRYGAVRVLDVATGTGFDSVRLIEAGFDVTSADGSPHMLVRAFENGKQRGHILRTVHADWRRLTRAIDSTYDAVICLGNSFTHLFTEVDQHKALAEFHAVLEHDGVLILDHRNYDAILSRGSGGGKGYYYCGPDVEVATVHIGEDLVRFRYRFADSSTYHLNMYPLRRDQVRRLLTDVGFQSIVTYSDFQGRDPDGDRDSEPDYYIHVAEKLYRR